MWCEGVGCPPDQRNVLGRMQKAGPIHHTPASEKFLLTLDIRLHEPIEELRGDRLLLRTYMSTCPTDIRLHEPI